MHRIERSIIAVLVSASMCAFWSPTHALAEPQPTVPATPALEAARDRALALEEEIETIRGEQIALQQRVDVTNARIFAQQEVLAAAREELDAARSGYRDRIVRIYKTRIVNPLSILLSADSISDFYARVIMLTRISQRDREAYLGASVAESEAEYQAAYLDDLKAQDVELRQIQTNRLSELEAALEEQQALVTQMTEEARKQLEALRARNALTRAEWRADSIPVGDPVPTLLATVDPYIGRTYIVSERQPIRYRTTGREEQMVCSWYGNEFNGRPTASGQIFNEEDLTCASRTLPFGTRLALTRGDARIIVVVNDRGPFIPGRDLDLSKAAARLLGFSGVQEVHAEFVEPLP